MRIVLLTRPTTAQGIATLEACSRKGLRISAVVVEPKTGRERWQRLRKVYRDNGFFLTLQKIWWILLEDYVPKIVRRRRKEAPPTVQEVSARLGVPVSTVDNHNGQTSETLLRSLEPDIILITGTRILRANIISIPRIGCINAHPGWLPDFRGINANLWAFLHGGRMGITTHFVDRGIDTGAILLRQEFTIEPGDSIESIERRATVECAHLTAETVLKLQAGSLESIPQSPEEGRQFRALPVRQEKEVRRLLRAMARKSVRERTPNGLL